MPCWERSKQKFQILKENIQELRNSNNGEIPYDQREEKRKAIEDLYARLKQSLETHQKELERLKKRLREATSEQEREQIEKEIAELEKELEGMHDALEELTEFMRDLERRVISQPSKADE